MRELIMNAMKAAMKSKSTLEISTLRLILAAIKDKDIELRTQTGSEDGISDEEILAVLSNMVKRRTESAKVYDEGGRPELAKKEREEMKIIERFLPKPLTDQELEVAIQKALIEVEAHSIKDMGKVMNNLKSQYAGQIDFSKASAMVKSALMVT